MSIHEVDTAVSISKDTQWRNKSLLFSSS